MPKSRNKFFKKIRRLPSSLKKMFQPVGIIKVYIKKYPRISILLLATVVLILVLPLFGFVITHVYENTLSPEIKLPQSSISGIICENYNRRPIAVTLAGDPVTRPLSGIADADLVFEMPVSPGGVTRIMAVYQCSEPKEIGSIRSAREGFVYLAMGMDAIFAHWGGEKDTLDKLNDSILDNIDALKYEGEVFYRKSGVARPHNGFTDYSRLYEASLRFEYRIEDEFEGYPHQKGRVLLGRETVNEIELYEKPYNVRWVYGEEANSYKRFRNNLPEVDKNTSKQIASKVVIVVETSGTPMGIEYLDVEIVGSGKAAVYQNGEKIEAVWEKESQKDAMRFFDLDDEEIKLVPGPIWIEIVTN